MNLTTAREKDAIEFMASVSKLAPDEFLGVAKILCLKLLDDNGEPKPAEKLIGDMIDKYWGLKKRVRRDILKVVKEAIGSDKNAESKVTTGKA